jgi:hypothetical protein
MEEKTVKIYVWRCLSLAIGLVAFGAVVVYAAEVEKYFDRHGTLIVQEKVEKYKRRADEGSTYPVPPPPFSEDIFPCSDCHADMEPNPQRRELVDMHEDIVLNHAEGQRWCLDCHNLDDRDTLRLISGDVIPFTESYQLCAHCHDPHSPSFKPLKPMPAPVRPENLNRQGSQAVPAHN